LQSGRHPDFLSPHLPVWTALQCLEGNNPVRVKASERDTTGVWERGMCAEGYPGTRESLPSPWAQPPERG
jgi:hypothetical protein